MNKIIYLISISTLLLLTFCTKRIVVEPAFNPIEKLKYDKDTILLQEGQIISSSMPTFTGSEPVSFQMVCTPFSDQISMDDKGIISTSKDLPAAIYNLTIKATNPTGTTSFKNVLTLHVYSFKKAPTEFFYTPNTITLNNNEAGSIPAPTITSTEAVVFSYTERTTGGTVPGISIDKTTGSFTITGLSIEGTYLLDIVASNSIGKAKTTLTIITVKPLVPRFKVNDNYVNFEKDMTFTYSLIPELLSGELPITFDIVEKCNGFLSNNILINKVNGTLYVLPSTPSGLYTIDVKATNKHGTTTIPLTFTYFTNAELMAAGAGKATFKNTVNIEAGKSAQTIASIITGKTIYLFDINNSPSGMTIDEYTGIIHVDANVPKGSYNIKITTTYAYKLRGSFTSASLSSAIITVEVE